MKHFLSAIAVIIGYALNCLPAMDQDPKLPPANLGLSNLQDGNPPQGNRATLVLAYKLDKK